MILGKWGNIQMRIVIVEDNREFADILKRKIDVDTGLGVGNVVDIYTEPKNFINMLKAGKRYELCFSDILMPEMDGLELAEQIRKIDDRMLFVFLTSYTEYAIDGYRVYAFDYLLKSHMDAKWDGLVKRIKEALDKQKKETYLIKMVNRVERVPCNSILYIYKQEKNVIFVLKDREIAVRKSIQDVWDELKDYRQFIQVKRGIIINIEKIRKATAKEIVMENGEEITIGRMYVEQVRKQIHNQVENI